jgi:hypothetical protein
MWRGDWGVAGCETRGVMSETLGCPRCGSRMLPRKNRQTGETFFGCGRFPDCKGTRRGTAARPPAPGGGSPEPKPRRRYRLSAGGRPRSLPDYLELLVARRIGRDLRPLEGFLVQVSAILVIAILFWAALTSGLFAAVVGVFSQWYASQVHLGPTPAPG